MFEGSLIVSRVLNFLIALYLVVNAGIAILRVRDPVLKYGRTSLGLVGLGLLATHIDRQFGDALGTLTTWIQVGGTILMLAGAYRAIRLFWKYPEARHRSLNLLAIGE